MDTDTFGQSVRRTFSNSYMDTRQKLRRSLSIDYKLIFWFFDSRSFIIGAGAVSVLFLAVVPLGKLDLRLNSHPNAWMMSSSLFILALTGLAARKSNSPIDHHHQYNYYYDDHHPRSSAAHSMISRFQEVFQLHNHYVISSSPTPAPPPPPPPSAPPSPLLLEQVSKEIATVPAETDGKNYYEKRRPRKQANNYRTAIDHHEYNTDHHPRSSSAPSMISRLQEDFQLHDHYMISSSPTPAPPPPPTATPPLLLEPSIEDTWKAMERFTAPGTGTPPLLLEPSIEDTWKAMEEFTAPGTGTPPSAPLLDDAVDEEEIDGPSIEDTWKAIMKGTGGGRKKGTWERYQRGVQETRALVVPPPLLQPKEPEMLPMSPVKEEKKKEEIGWRNLTKVVVDTNELYHRAEMLIKYHRDHHQLKKKLPEKGRRRRLQTEPSRS